MCGDCVNWCFKQSLYLKQIVSERDALHEEIDRLKAAAATALKNAVLTPAKAAVPVGAIDDMENMENMEPGRFLAPLLSPSATNAGPTPTTPGSSGSEPPQALLLVQQQLADVQNALRRRETELTECRAALKLARVRRIQHD